MSVSETLIPRADPDGGLLDGVRMAVESHDRVVGVGDTVSLTRMAEQCLAWRDGCAGIGVARGLRRRMAGLLVPAAVATAQAGTVGATGWTPETIRPHLERDNAGAIPSLPDAWMDLAAVTPKKMAMAWHVAADAARKAFMAAGVRNAVERPAAFVRFIDVTGRDASSADCSHFDIPVSYTHGRGVHTQEVWAAGREYVAELWLRVGAGGPAVPVARSNRIALPRDAAGTETRDSDRHDARWLETPARPDKTDIDVLAELAREDVADNDAPWRDQQTEATVRALYRALLTVGPRVFRQAPALPYRTPEECREAFECRRRMRAARPRRRAAGAVPAVSGVCWIGRLDRPAPTPEASEALTWPPVPHATANAAAAVPAVEKTVMAKPGIPAGTVADASELALSVSVVLRGKVRPGRRVRVGGRAVPTRDDGSFQVNYDWREGLRLPVEVMPAGQPDGVPVAAKILAF